MTDAAKVTKAEERIEAKPDEVAKKKVDSFSNLSGSAETIAKYGAAIAAIALGTAFVYDSVVWWLIDYRMLGFFSLPDHVETAVQVVVFLAGLSLFAAIPPGLAYLVAIPLAPLRAKRPVDFFIIAISALLLITFYFWMRAYGPGHANPDDKIGGVDGTLLVVFLVGMLSLTMFLSERDFAKTQKQWLDSLAKFLFYVIVWTVITCGFAVLFAKDARVPSTWAQDQKDVVVIAGDKELSGKVMRVLDRGVILFDMNDRRLIFIPKEKIERVNHSVPVETVAKRPV